MVPGVEHGKAATAHVEPVGAETAAAVLWAQGHEPQPHQDPGSRETETTSPERRSKGVKCEKAGQPRSAVAEEAPGPN